MSSFNHIKTSRENKTLVTELTRKLNLGPENIIARIALTYSLSLDRKLNLKDIKDAQGKEYRSSVLFGDNLPNYIALICTQYNLYKTDKDIPRYIKMHIDDGLGIIQKEIEENSNISGFDYLIQKIEDGLIQIK